MQYTEDEVFAAMGRLYMRLVKFEQLAQAQAQQIAEMEAAEGDEEPQAEAD